MYVKEDIARARVRPRNIDKRKNIGCQATGDKETQENREKIKKKSTQYPKKEISPMESLILLRGKYLYGEGKTKMKGMTPINQL
jgi:hypothetical protein